MRKSEDNIKMDLQVDCECMGVIQPVYDWALWQTCEHGSESSGTAKRRDFLDKLIDC
jgi:hypothetical protein